MLPSDLAILGGKQNEVVLADGCDLDAVRELVVGGEVCTSIEMTCSDLVVLMGTTELRNHNHLDSVCTLCVEKVEAVLLLVDRDGVLMRVCA